MVKQRPDRVELVAFENGFHGRTFGALSVTGQPKYREGFGPLVGPVRFLPFGDVAAARAAITDATCADHRRADPGRRGDQPAAAWLPQRAAQARHRDGDGPDLRRDPDRRRADRNLLRLRGGGGRPRCHHPGEGAGGRRAHRRDARERGRRPRLRAGDPRVDLRRQPVRDRRRAVRAAGDRRARAARPLPRGRGLPRVGAAAPGRAAPPQDPRGARAWAPARA